MVGRGYKFELSDTQYEKLKAFNDQIISERGSSYCGAIGGGVTFKITPTAIGDFVSAECFGKEIDLSEV